MKVYFISGPYRGVDDTPWSRRKNTAMAVLVGRKIMADNPDVTCCVPHVMFDNWDGHDLDNEHILDGCLELVKRCDVIVMLPGWEGSEGAKAELRVARQNWLDELWW